MTTTAQSPAGFASAQDVIDFCRAQDVRFIDLKFTDVPGMWQHLSVPVSEVTDVFGKGIGFDGSSIRGFQHIHESDMLLVGDPTTAFLDPFASVPTLSVTCNVRDVTGDPYGRDPRHIAQRAEAYLKSTGIATTSYWGPELEFFVFNDVRYDSNAHCSYYFVDSDEGIWNSGRDERPNLGYKPRHKEGYFPAPPTDTLQQLRSEMVLRLIEAGISVEAHHHEVATAGQCEIDMRFDSLTAMADKVMVYKYLVKNVARSHGQTVTFMPKPLFGDNGSGMHTHQSLWKDGTPLFYEKGAYAGLSQLALWYIGGLLRHAPALLALCAPTTNSYRRLVPGYEAPVNLAYSARNRSAAIRIPMYFDDPKAKRLEFRCPDPTANPYLAFAACLMAGIDGIQNKIDPGKPVDTDIYELPRAQARRIKQVPGSLDAALAALEADHAFLTKGGVFTEEFLDLYIAYKREKEADAIRLRPHPYEFTLYFDA